MMVWSELSSDEREFVATVQAWMKSPERITTTRQRWISICGGSCQKNGALVMNCLTYGCCVGMEEHFPPGYSKREVQKRWDSRSWWEKRRGLDPKLIIPPWDPWEAKRQREREQRERWQEENARANKKQEQWSREQKEQIEEKERRENKHLKPQEGDDVWMQHAKSLFPMADTILLQAVAKWMENWLERGGDCRSLHFTPEEQQAYDQLSRAQYSRMSDLGTELSIERKKRRDTALLERYMKLYLQQFGPPMEPIETGKQRAVEIRKQEKIREHFTKEELKDIDDLWFVSAWEQTKTKPDILRLLGEMPPVPEEYQTMSHAELQREAARASAEIYRATQTGGLMLFAPSGWGKSRLLGRSICYQYAVNKIGSVTLDVVGGTIDNALDKIARHQPVAERQEIGSRIRYCNMAGEQLNGEVVVTGWPMLVKRYPNESLHTTTQRIVDLIATTDKNLATASIQGFNRLAPLLTSVTMVLAALRLPLALSYQLLSDPQTWEKRIRWVGQHVPEAQEAVADILEFYDLDTRKQEERSEVLRNKLSLLKFDQVSRAMFSTPEPLIDWSEVAEQGLQVYIDLRFETSDQAREMKLFWVWNSLMEFIRSRGASGRQQKPLAVVIDELSFFVRGQHLNTDAISEEFREFVQVRRRNANILLTAATQEWGELPEKLQSACLQIPSQLYGATSDTVIALKNAQRWYRKDPERRKGRAELHLLQVREPTDMWGRRKEESSLLPLENAVEPTRAAYMSYEEQDYENSRIFLELPKGEWLFGKSPAEGVPASGLEHITTAHLDQGKWVREEIISQFRRHLMQRDGIPVAQVLSRLTALSQKRQKKQAVPQEQLKTHARTPERVTPAEPVAEDDMGRHRQESEK